MNRNNRIVAVQLSNVTKQYTIHHEKPTFVEKFIKGRDERFTALDHITLTVHQGERVGIIGKNGSGKTTLLKIIAGITAPTQGSVMTHGKLVSLIDLDAGFHPELTGEQNIFLCGMLLGMRKADINSKLGCIIKFADIGGFIDAPLFTYSTGMKLRLGFSVAIHTDPDVLILDEGIHVGDEEFAAKTYRKLQDFFRIGKTLLFVSHQLKFIEDTCNRVLVMDRGSIIKDGHISLVSQYRKAAL